MTENIFAQTPEESEAEFERNRLELAQKINDMRLEGHEELRHADNEHHDWLRRRAREIEAQIYPLQRQLESMNKLAAEMAALRMPAPIIVLDSQGRIAK